MDRGELAASRYGSYLKMLDEIDPEGAYDTSKNEVVEPPE